MSLIAGFHAPNFRSLSGFGWTEIQELGLRFLLPRGFSNTISIKDLDHEEFTLDQASGLYDPAANGVLQQGTFTCFIFGPAVLWPSVGGIADPDGHLIRESFLSDHFFRQSVEHRLLKKFPIQRSTAPYVTCLGHIHRNYFHRHIDSIPRLFALHHPRLLALPEIELIVDPRFSAQELELIQYLIPENVHIRKVSYTTRIKVERYIHLPFLSGKRHEEFEFIQNCAGYLPQEYLDRYRKSLSDRWGLSADPVGERIYISRAKAKIRHLSNEAEVVDHLLPYGFKVYQLEGMSLSDQAQLFAGASVILTLHGAALTNLLYASPEATVIEVFAKRKLPIFSTLARALGMQYESIMLNGKDKNDDVFLPVEKLERALKRAGIEKVVS